MRNTWKAQPERKLILTAAKQSQIPDSPAFDAYALKGESQGEIKSVEQGKK